MPDQPASKQPKVALYVTCLINSLRPEIGFACVKLLESLGFAVEVPPGQTCCGQPGYNGGQRAQAKAVAKTQLLALENYDHIVVPSGSCAGMIVNHYPRLFADEPDWLKRAEAVATKTRELCQFLFEHDWRPGKSPKHSSHPVWAYHTSCSCRRETQSHAMGEELLMRIGIKLGHMKDQDVCCGFGGAFAAKYDALSTRMGHNKLDAAAACDANAITSADLGCLLQLESLDHSGMEFTHIAVLLAHCIGEAPSSHD